VIGGNEDPQGVVLKDLSPPPVAVALRVYPRAPRAMSVCLRLELYGCPWDGQLGRNDGDGAWCPAGPVFPDEDEFLEVDLGHLHLVTLVGTQGRHAGGHGKEFARTYRLRYSRDRRRWLPWRDRWGTEPPPNVPDPSPGVTRVTRLSGTGSPLVSPWVTGIPSPHPLAVPRLLFGGLGQLADGVLGLDDFTRSRERRLWPGYDYVGWRRPPGPQPRLELEFEFEQMRVFRAMQVPHGMPAPWEPKAGQPVAKADHSHTSILIGCLVAIILLLLAVIVLILWRHHWRKILGKAQRRPSEEELRVQLSVPGDTVVINNATGVGRGPPRYERIPPGPGEYQEPTRPPLPPVPPVPGEGRDFLQEARTLGRLRDPNIVRLLGVCSGPGGPLCIITEYMEHGDLHRFLGGPCGPTL
ncbi:epithelial discoidin domain-containing receptor 1-like, partial [Numida meleagris]|uniref:epithelial discoidin domain-containing receptor 1-like n=1 Tax=Numida meleagris TaxID=8996 RepID=UPI000B3E137C